MNWRAFLTTTHKRSGSSDLLLWLGIVLCVALAFAIGILKEDKLRGERIERDDAARTAQVIRTMARAKDPAIPYLGKQTKSRVAIENDLLVVCRNARLWLFDLSNPTSPTLTATLLLGKRALDFGEIASDMEIYSGHAFVANPSGDLSIVAVADRTNPSLVGKLALPEACHDISIANGLLAAACGIAGVEIRDVADPTSPSLVVSLPDISTQEGEDAPEFFDNYPGAHGVDWEGNHLYVSDRNLKCFDMSQPTHPRLVGRYDTLRWGQKVVADGQQVFALFVSGGPAIFDSHDPTQLKLSGLYMSNGYSPELVPTSFGFMVQGTDHFPSPIEFVSLAVPEIPKQLHFFSTHLAFSNIACRSDLAYYLSEKDRLIILNISDPSSPKVEGIFPLSAYVDEIRKRQQSVN